VEDWEYSEIHKVVTTKKNDYEDGVDSDEESDGAKEYWNLMKKSLV
jgi:uncharacterized protein YeeX (DUF496 family)